MKKSLFFSIAIFSTMSGLCHAQGDYFCGQFDSGCIAPTSIGSSNVKSTRWYTGLVWELGGVKSSATPDLVVGVRRSTTKNIDSVTGADASLRIELSRPLGLDSIRLSYLQGKPALLGQVGAGYSFQYNSLLFTGAFQSAHFRLSTDYLLDSAQFQFFGEVNTMKKPGKAGVGELSCELPYQRVAVTESGNEFELNGVPVSRNAVKGGYTCTND